MAKLKDSKVNNRKRGVAKNSIIAILAVLLVVLGIGGFLGTRTVDYGQDPTEGVNVLRSQVLVDGSGLKLDTEQEEQIQEEQQEREEQQEEQSEENPVKSSSAWQEAAPGNAPGEGEGGSGEGGIGDTPAEDSHAPVITTDLINGGSYASYVSFFVTAKDYKGRDITRQYMEVYINGERVYSSGSNNIKGLYDFEGTDGSNTISIKVTDREGNVSNLNFTITCDSNQAQETDGTCYVTISAKNIGCGFVFGPVEVTLYKGEKMSHLITRVMNEYGIAYDYSGSITSSFYLSRIYKNGITTGYHIPDNILAGLEEIGATTNDNIYPNSLGEKDFYQGSGWMYTYNGEVPGVAISDQTVLDGDEIEIWFTTYMGYDRDGGWNTNTGL